MKKSVKWLKRKSSGYMILPEDIDAIGVEGVLPKVIGLDSAEDGIYEIVVCNEYRDWESGYVEDWDYKLIPYEEE